MGMGQKRISRGYVAPVLLRDFTIGEKIHFMRGWYLGCGRGRWTTWEQFFDDADAVKGELLTDPTIRRLYGDLEPFADRLRRELGPGQVYDSHGGWPGHIGPCIAIRHAHVFTPGDNHRHDGDGGAGGVQVPGDREPVLV